jgi:hypothetical protein
LDVRLKLYSPTPGAPQHARGVCLKNPAQETLGRSSDHVRTSHQLIFLSTKSCTTITRVSGRFLS